MEENLLNKKEKKQDSLKRTLQSEADWDFVLFVNLNKARKRCALIKSIKRWRCSARKYR